jgi:acetoin utilization deacetylase AcuC-like enzyme
MKIVFHNKFYESGYADNNASAEGRMEAAMSMISSETHFDIVQPVAADEEIISLAHSREYIDSVKHDSSLYYMARLSAGGAVEASNIAITGEAAFACIRPPGHHAWKDHSWGYCVFSNMGIALLQLKQRHKIGSAFVLDFDAHTGDGTKDVLSQWKECFILNPYPEGREGYLKLIEDYIKDIADVDIVAVCAGFDSYEKDAGRMLTTDDFYQIGLLMKKFSEKSAKGRRFAILEGGYYLPDLGENVLAFCRGFQ